MSRTVKKQAALTMTHYLDQRRIKKFYIMTMQKTNNSQHYHHGKQIITLRISAKTRQNKFQNSNFTANTGVINGSFPKMELGFVPGTNIPAVFLNSKTSDTYVL